MNSKWIRTVGLSALATVACMGVSNTARADHYNYGHNHGCSPHVGYPQYGYRPITTLPYYGSNYGVSGYSRNYGGFANNYGGHSSNYGGYNNFGGGYGVGGYPRSPSYGGGSFPRGGSYGGGAYPRGGSYGGGGFSLYIGR